MDRRTFAGGTVTRLLIVVAGLVALTVTTSTPLHAAASRECATVFLDSPFRLPDGILYPAGSLTLCDSRTLSPVGSLHRVLVGGASVGQFVSRRRYAEVRARDSAEFLFRHGADGHLELIGYTVPKAGRSVAYRLSGQPPAAAWQASGLHADGGGTAPVAAIVATTGTR